MNAIIQNVELRSFETRKNKNGDDYGIITFEDPNYLSHRIIFRDMNLCSLLHGCRGKIADLVCELDLGSYANIYVKFVELHDD